MSQDISAALERLSQQIMTLPGVAAIGEGLCDGEPCFRVYVVNLTPDVEGRIPSTFEGYKVVVEKSGEIRALSEDDSTP